MSSSENQYFTEKEWEKFNVKIVKKKILHIRLSPCIKLIIPLGNLYVL